MRQPWLTCPPRWPACSARRRCCWHASSPRLFLEHFSQPLRRSCQPAPQRYVTSTIHLWKTPSGNEDLFYRG